MDAGLELDIRRWLSETIVSARCGQLAVDEEITESIAEQNFQAAQSVLGEDDVEKLKDKR